MNVVCGVCLASLVFAAEPPTLKVRVTGLFSRDREADLRALLKDADIEVVSLDFDHAEAELRFDAGKLFPKVKRDELIPRLDETVRNASQHTMGVKPPTAVPRDELKRVEIRVVGLDCKACCLALYEIVAKIDGVEQATASFKDGLVTALIDPKKADRAKLEDALRKRGVTLR
jgi:copper chaperone CopZ